MLALIRYSFHPGYLLGSYHSLKHAADSCCILIGWIRLLYTFRFKKLHIYVQLFVTFSVIFFTFRVDFCHILIEWMFNLEVIPRVELYWNTFSGKGESYTCLSDVAIQ